MACGAGEGLRERSARGNERDATSLRYRACGLNK